MAFVSTGAVPVRASKRHAFCAPRHARHAPRRTASSAKLRMTAGAEAAAPAAAGGIEAAWGPFAERMRAAGETPAAVEWNALLDAGIAACDAPAAAIWVLDTMRSTGRTPTVGSYERVLRLCALRDDRPAAFHLVEHMWKDGVLLGDVELPDGMEAVLRNILPPEAFD